MMIDLLNRVRPKIFCIGLNKTGTTTVERVLKDFNFKLGDQNASELLLKKWFRRDFKAIIDFSKKAEAFQDVPFSLPFTYILLDQYFPNSKFILTVRDSAEQWYNSITQYHSKLWSNRNEIPTEVELKKALYRYKGYAYEFNKAVFNSPSGDPYNEDILKRCYLEHNRAVKEYFRGCHEKLLVVNVSIADDYFRLCTFLDKEPQGERFPWENKTIE